MTAKYYTKNKNGKRYLAMSILINGTVFSGHPLRTTWGNTTRIMILIGWIKHKHGLTFCHF